MTLKLDASVRYRWVNDASVLFFMGKGNARRRSWITEEHRDDFERVHTLARKLYRVATARIENAPGLGDYITLRWLSRTNELRFYGDRKLKYTMPQDDDTAAFRASLEVVYSLSDEELV